MTIQDRLRRAVSSDSLAIHYQPIVDLASSRVVGAEALIRWRDLELGDVPPERLIPVAEEAGIMVELGRWVVSGVGAQTRRWQEAGWSPLRIGINLTPVECQSPGLVAHVQEVLQRNGTRPGTLCVEVTELVLAAPKGGGASLETLHRLRDLGVQVALDNYGNGYASLDEIPGHLLDAVKVDQGLIQGVPGDAGHAERARRVIAEALSLGLEVVAKGVETMEQLAFVEAQGCGLVQGFLFDQPMSAEDLSRLLVR